MAQDLANTVQLLYRAVLKRDPNPAEIKRDTQSLQNGQDVLDIVQRLNNSKEAERYKIRLFVPPGHFYSPICDPDLLREKITRRREPIERELPGLDLDLERMSTFWKDALLPHAKRIPFPDKPHEAFRFHFENPAFSFGDAIILNAMILHFRPKQIIEVGSGWSSACMLDTIASEPSLSTHCTFIEPFPALLEKTIWPTDKETAKIIATPVQKVDLSEFERLQENDILFIDSTHVAKTGSDVVYELCEILPRLNKGVVIHFHDIFYPFEYGYMWAIEQNRSWNEIYALRNFLTFNDRFEVIFFSDMFFQLRRQMMLADCPAFMKNAGGSIWLRRTR